MRFHRIDVRYRNQDIEIAPRYPVAERPKSRPVLQKALAKELRHLADLLESEGFEDGGTATGRETEARSLLISTRGRA